MGLHRLTVKHFVQSRHLEKKCDQGLDSLRRLHNGAESTGPPLGIGFIFDRDQPIARISSGWQNRGKICPFVEKYPRGGTSRPMKLYTLLFRDTLRRKDYTIAVIQGAAIKTR